MTLRSVIGDDDALGGDDGMNTSSIFDDEVDEELNVIGLDCGVCEDGGERRDAESKFTSWISVLTFCGICSVEYKSIFVSLEEVKKFLFDALLAE